MQVSSSATAVGISKVAWQVTLLARLGIEPRKPLKVGAFTIYNESILSSMSHSKTTDNSIFSIYQESISLPKNR